MMTPQKQYLVRIRTTWLTQQNQWGLYQSKVTSSLAAIQRPGHRADNCKMIYCDQLRRSLNEKKDFMSRVFWKLTDVKSRNDLHKS